MSRTEQLSCCCFSSPLAMTTATRWESRLGDLSESETLPVGCQVPVFGFYSCVLEGDGSASPVRAVCTFSVAKANGLPAGVWATWFWPLLSLESQQECLGGDTNWQITSGVHL